jgi:hypothetical protein
VRNAEMLFVENRVEGIRPGTLKYVPWDEVALRLTIPTWELSVREYPDPLRGVTAESVPDQVPKLREIGSRIRDPKGMLLSPEQRTVRAGRLFASALALAMVRNGWELQVGPGLFRLTRGNQEFNPFLAVDQLMTKKLSQEGWTARCQELGISRLFLFPSSAPEPRPGPSAQAELFS